MDQPNNLKRYYLKNWAVIYFLGVDWPLTTPIIFDEIKACIYVTKEWPQQTILINLAQL